MSCMIHTCTRCAETEMNNKPIHLCPKCGDAMIASFDEEYDNDPETDEEGDTDVNE